MQPGSGRHLSQRILWALGILVFLTGFASAQTTTTDQTATPTEPTNAKNVDDGDPLDDILFNMIVNGAVPRDFDGGPPGFGRRGPGGPGFGPEQKRDELIPRFDKNGDGKLNTEERAAARDYRRQNSPMPSSESKTLSPPPDLAVELAESTAAAPGKGTDLYDETVLRTLYLRFPDGTWFGEVSDFYHTDVEVPADLVVDGKVYPSVGVRFRGNSSYFGLGESAKKSLNISIDYEDQGQRLYGYKTLELLNGHADPSFMRAVLFSHISRHYIAAPKANFVKLVVNGENWGVYISIQQFNKDFLRDQFGTRSGVRWKAPVGFGGSRGLAWSGPDKANYEDAYQLKTSGDEEALDRLIRMCEILNTTPVVDLEDKLSAVLDIDEALWFLALENVFTDNDGYISRGSDYALYEDPDGQFHLIPHDSNETFRFAGGGGPNSFGDQPMLDPLMHADSDERPLIQKLMAVPHLRERYLAHIRTITNEWLDWKTIGPIVDAYQELLDAEVQADDKKLYSYEAFASCATKDFTGGEMFGPPGGFPMPPGGVGMPFSGDGPPLSPADGGMDQGRGFGRGRRGPGARVTPGFKRFVEERHDYLLGHPAVNKPAPTILSVSTATLVPSEPIRVKAKIDETLDLRFVILYYAIGEHSPFKSTPMFDDGKHADGQASDGMFAAEIPPTSVGVDLRYYVEARAATGTAAFYPLGTQRQALKVRLMPSVAASSPVVINEFMAQNTKSLMDPQGEYDDWLELHNLSDAIVDLTGMYLSDDEGDPYKWAFPEGTTIPAGGYLLVWTDGDTEATSGLHASFKLSSKGEVLLLTSSDSGNQTLLDRVKFGRQEPDTAVGRSPDGTGSLARVPMTPGASNP